MGAVAQAFPSFHGINGRSFALAFIVVLHLAFYAAFTSINPPRAVVQIPPDIEYVPIERQPPPKPTPRLPGGEQVDIGPVAPLPPDTPPSVDIDSTAWNVPVPPPGPVEHVIEEPGAGPVLVEPQIDPRRGLREPVYPPSEIRQNHTGTVQLSVEVLPDGSVGNVRLDSSSGYPKLDEAALRIARSWRFIPGTRDGAAVAMWKRVPITFQLRN